jgi:hypothetical protein
MDALFAFAIALCFFLAVISMTLAGISRVAEAVSQSARGRSPASDARLDKGSAWREQRAKSGSLRRDGVRAIPLCGVVRRSCAVENRIAVRHSRLATFGGHCLPADRGGGAGAALRAGGAAIPGAGGGAAVHGDGADFIACQSQTGDGEWRMPSMWMIPAGVCD